MKNQTMDQGAKGVALFSGENVPLEMHKVRMVQRVNLLPVGQRLRAIQEAGNNTFLLRNRDIFLDMLTDSGVNAMSENQFAAMMLADDSYAGSETFYRLEEQLKSFFGKEFFLPAHQGRACENIIATTLVTPGSVALMNYHFTTTKAHITRNGGEVVELIRAEGIDPHADIAFKGNFDLAALEAAIAEAGAENVAFIRAELGTNLVGGQPVSLENLRQVSAIGRKHGIYTVADASLLADNLHFIKTLEHPERELGEIVLEIGSLFDVIYFSGRKLGCSKGGGICTSDPALYDKMKVLVPLFEGFLTYGGMSLREMEAMTVGLQETLDAGVISQTPIFVAALSRELEALGVPVVTPSGGLGCHIDARAFVPHIPQDQYPAAALASAIFIASGVRGMERGTMSEQRNPDGSEHPAQMELVRLAVPKRVFTLSHIKYTADRIGWLWKNREKIGGLRFTEEPEMLRFFLGRLEAIGSWQEELAQAFDEAMPSGL